MSIITTCLLLSRKERVLSTTIPSIFSSINALDIGGNALVLHNLLIGKGGNNWAKKGDADIC